MLKPVMLGSASWSFSLRSRSSRSASRHSGADMENQSGVCRLGMIRWWPGATGKRSGMAQTDWYSAVIRFFISAAQKRQSVSELNLPPPQLLDERHVRRCKIELMKVSDRNPIERIMGV